MGRRALALVALLNAAGAARNAYLGDWTWVTINVVAFLAILAWFLVVGLGQAAKRGDAIAPERDEGQGGQQ